MLYALNGNNPPSCLLLQFSKGQSNSKLLASRWSVASGLYLNGLTVIIADSSNHQAQTRLFDFFNLILHLFALPQVAHISSGDQYQRICDLTALQKWSLFLNRQKGLG